MLCYRLRTRHAVRSPQPLYLRYSRCVSVRDVESEDSIPDSLFHYTTAAGLLGMITTRTLWATDVRFLNDAEESRYGFKAMFDAIDSLENPVREPGHWAYEMELESQRQCSAYGPADTFDVYRTALLQNLSKAAFGVYTACFCASDDLLSQWRGYGADHGYSVEFRAEGLAAALGHVRAGSAELVQVRYGTDASREVIDKTLSRIRAFNLNHPGTRAFHMAMLAASRIASLKHPSFEEEQEWRILVTYPPSPQKPSSPQYFAEEPSSFRATSMAIVPYIVIPFPLEVIKAVRVGPGNNGDIREAGVLRLLKSAGSAAEVTRSMTPLRA